VAAAAGRWIHKRAADAGQVRRRSYSRRRAEYHPERCPYFQQLLVFVGLPGIEGLVGRLGVVGRC